MSEKEPQFTVTDRRKFTLEGDLREGENESPESPGTVTAEERAAPAAASPAAPPPESAAQQTSSAPADAEAEESAGPTAEESAQQSKDYHASARQLDDLVRQANAGAASAPMNFDRLVQSIYMTAAVQMGAGTAPNEQPRIDILGARQSIDMLGVLDEKTRGNLTEEEKRLLQGALFDLRMSFLEVTNAINSSAQQPPRSGKAR